MPKEDWSNFIYFNNIGRKLEMTLGSPIILRQISRAHIAPVTRDLLLLKIHILEYEKIHGTLPKSLDLLPRTAPIFDTFTKLANTPYHYSTEDRHIWSVGPNFENDTDRCKDFDYSNQTHNITSPESGTDDLMVTFPNKLNL